MSQKSFGFVYKPEDSKDLLHMDLYNAKYAGEHLEAVLANNLVLQELEHKQLIRRTLREIAKAWGLKVSGED